MVIVSQRINVVLVIYPSWLTGESTVLVTPILHAFDFNYLDDRHSD